MISLQMQIVYEGSTCKIIDEFVAYYHAIFKENDGKLGRRFRLFKPSTDSRHPAGHPKYKNNARCPF